MARTQTEGNPGGEAPEALTEGPMLAPAPGNTTGVDPLCDQDGDEVSDYIDKSAFTDTVG